MRRHFNKKNLILLVLFIILLFTIYYLKMSGFLEVDYLKNLIESFGMLAPFIFASLYIVITLTGLSAAFFTILAGIIFGVKLALFVVVIAATIAATIAFYIARYFKNKLVIDDNSENKNDNKKKQNKVIQKLVHKINKISEKNGFFAIVILRLSFLPYIPLSYASGLVPKLKARDFILATFLTNIFGSFVFIFLGASFTQSIPLFLFAIVLVVLFMQIPKLIKRFS